MAIDIIVVIIGGFLASIIWFIIGGFLYMNPIIAKIYEKHENSEGLKKWDDLKKYLGTMYILGNLIQCLCFSLVYAFIKPILPGDLILNSLFFGIILILIKIIPRFLDMWIQSTYPNALLVIELINGTIGCFVISLILTIII